ncbi:DUF485 domain-containing protein [Bacillus aerolatus]|uniref:DUF485 domain-containing protein n=1 Tax=Bacillus aerolatus TaxID=2653354 RepID=A0A6I1FJK1_9BACI|nr:DUF485 domain-containing protein [Bacillus aerolatus]KAB7706594.1 DUF485 domain-containing protein [Bacillus aerolatus]
MGALSKKDTATSRPSVHKTSYTHLTQQPEFRALLKKKKAFILPMTIFFLVFYFLLPTLAAYTNILEAHAFGGLTWAWVYALAQFVVVWVAGVIYIKKAQGYDSMAEDILAKHKEELDA